MSIIQITTVNSFLVGPKVSLRGSIVLKYSLLSTEYCLRRVCPSLLGAAQEAVPGRADSQRDRGVQQTMLRLVVQPLRTRARKVPGDGRQVRRGIS